MDRARRIDVGVLDAARERVYRFLGTISSHPDAGEWGRLTCGEEQALDIAAVDAIRAAFDGQEAQPVGAVEAAELDLRGLVVELCQPLGHLRADYERFFVRSRLTSHSPLEMDHQGPWRRRHPERELEQLAHEYDEAGCPEHDNLSHRTDHAARELGFMAWLISASRMERRLIDLGASSTEAAHGCDLAQRQFFGDHLAEWLLDLAGRLQEHAGGGCLERLGRFLTAWITLERHYLNADPRFQGATESSQGASAPRRGRRSHAVSA